MLPLERNTTILKYLSSKITDVHPQHFAVSLQTPAGGENKYMPVMLQWDDNNRVAKSLATSNENEPLCSSQQLRNEEKELLQKATGRQGKNLSQRDSQGVA